MSSGFDFETLEPGNVAGKDTWLTPPELVAKLGKFDLDPCAAPSPRPWEFAERNYDLTQGEDGLVLSWQDIVWPNAIGILFLRGRLSFFHGDGSKGGTAGSPSALVAFSNEDYHILVRSKIPGCFIDNTCSVIVRK